MVVPWPWIAAGIGIGVYAKGGSLKETAFWTGTTWAVSQTVIHPIRTATSVASAARYTWTTPLKTMTGDFVGSKAIRGGAALALAAVTGAVVGTTVSQVIWGEEGARDALTFYGFDAGGGDPHYWDQGEHATPGYFNIPGNAAFIAKHYWQQWTS